MVLLISVLIIIHELGHFLAAKSIGINPERFGLGLPLGPTLYEKKFGETIFCIHAFLLGGYVSFPEDNPKTTLLLIIRIDLITKQSCKEPGSFQQEFLPMLFLPSF